MYNSVKLVGVKDGLKAVLSDVAKYSEIKTVMLEKMNETKELFQAKSEMNLYIEGGKISHQDKCDLRKCVQNIIGEDVLITFTDHAGTKQVMPVIYESVFHRGTLRSGQNVSSTGHLIILGDVNPGAEVSAVGNVVVLGALKGIVHAGMEGDRDCCIIALQLNPTQIRIADIITRAPDEQAQVVPEEPEMAYVIDNRIYIEGISKKK